jgi:hypothetical protein
MTAIEPPTRNPPDRDRRNPTGIDLACAQSPKTSVEASHTPAQEHRSHHFHHHHDHPGQLSRHPTAPASDTINLGACGNPHSRP